MPQSCKVCAPKVDTSNKNNIRKNWEAQNIKLHKNSNYTRIQSENMRVELAILGVKVNTF